MPQVVTRWCASHQIAVLYLALIKVLKKLIITLITVADLQATFCSESF